jgi:hypothetical protein
MECEGARLRPLGGRDQLNVIIVVIIITWSAKAGQTSISRRAESQKSRRWTSRCRQPVHQGCHRASPDTRPSLKPAKLPLPDDNDSVPTGEAERIKKAGLKPAHGQQEVPLRRFSGQYCKTTRATRAGQCSNSGRRRKEAVGWSPRMKRCTVMKWEDKVIRICVRDRVRTEAKTIMEDTRRRVLERRPVPRKRGSRTIRMQRFIERCIRRRRQGSQLEEEKRTWPRTIIGLRTDIAVSED